MNARPARRALRYTSALAGGMWLFSPTAMSSCLQLWTRGDARRHGTAGPGGNQPRKRG